MQALTKAEITKLPACDVQLEGIEWHGNDLVLTLVVPAKGRAKLTATFAHHLRVTLEFDDQSAGCPLSWDTTYTALPNGDWHVLMDFAHTGAVEFECSQLHFRYVDAS
jgi:hypothetical protein